MIIRHKPARPWLRACAGAAVLATLTACGDSQQADNTSINAVMSGNSKLLGTTYAAEIRRTSHGIPHIRALNEAGLGFGVGYAYAQDNICQLADEIVTVNGERSKYFGAEASGPNPQLVNLQTDYFYQLINDPASVATAWQKQPAAMRELVEGWVAGYNHYLQKTGVAKLPAECRDAAWVRNLTTSDFIKLVRRYAAEGGSGQFIASIVGAAPPGVTPAAAPPKPNAVNPMTPAYWKELRAKTGSNAVALGRDASANGQGLLLSNPHFPWQGSLRFYQLHLTIPNKLDAMGASLGGMPIVNIGFNNALAWGHTVNTSAHFTAFVLNLDPSDPTRYVVDGKMQAMSKRTVSIQVKGADGVLRTQSRDFYSTPYGMLAVVPGMLDWSGELAYTIRDANLDNHRMLEQWNAMNRAGSLTEFRTAIEKIVGLPWVNTVAADRAGNTLYTDVTVVPNVSPAKQAMCVPEPFKPLAAQGLYVLAGAYSSCQWGSEPGAPQAGIFAGASLPKLTRTDYVQNSNDSAWLSNPKAPLVGFPDIVSVAGTEQSGRTRLGISQIQARLAGTDGLPGRRMSMEQLQAITLNNRSYYADRVMDELLTVCSGDKAAQADDGTPVDLTLPCQQLAAWNRTANLDANIGFAYFNGIWQRARLLPNLWAVPFNPQDPVNTPRQLNVGDAGTSAALKSAFASAVRDAQALGWSATTLWGEVQGSTRGDKWIPIHGGPDALGIYNAVDSIPVAPGKQEVVFGTSYIQTVGFDLLGVKAQAMLSYSQSSDPASPWYADQTERFSQKKWITLPFTDSQIAADPNLSTTVLIK